MSFHVGQKVVCVRVGNTSLVDRISMWWHGAVRCPLGFVGTVCNVYVAYEREFIELAERPSPEAGPWRAGFKASAFRPIVERKTDISIFTAMLDGVKQGERI